ncbi:MAG: hypothetical protein AAF716_22385 [Cyanobacteria bacterium P01_D01_bin.1]
MNQNIRYSLPWLLLGLVLTFAVPSIASLLPEKDLSSWNVLYLLPTFGFGLWGLSWPYRKQKAGALLFDAGRTWQNKILFWVGIVESGVATFVTWLSIERMIASPTTVERLLQMPRVIFWWTIAILLLSLGLSKLELRKNGFCFLYTFLPWRRVSAYSWEPSQPDVWTVRVRRRLLLWSNLISIRVPREGRDEIARIADTYVSRR